MSDVIHHGPVIAERDGLTVLDCRMCGWAHLDPLPAVSEGYYESEFWQRDKAGWLARYEAQRDWLDMRDQDYLSVVEEHVAGTVLLDVGCGYGFFLQAAQSRGWVSIGLDVSVEACQYAKAHGVLALNQPLETLDLPAKPDVISALWLMEHLDSPMSFLSWCRAHLAQGGALLLAVPQEFTALQAQANEIAKVHDWFVHVNHLSYWTAATLYNLLGRAGFRVVDALSSWPMEQYIMMEFDYTADDAIGASVHENVRHSELNMSREQRIGYQRYRALSACGRDLVVIAKADA